MVAGPVEKNGCVPSRTLSLEFANPVTCANVVARASVDAEGVTLRCAGFNQVDLAAATRLALPVVRVPEYSPHAVAEHTIGLVLTLDRRLHKAYNRVREGNFSLEGLLGFDLHGRTVGVVGTGRIGRRVAEICLGFGCRVLAHDPTIAARSLEWKSATRAAMCVRVLRTTAELFHAFAMHG
mgnify:CR=1 FL=1